MSSFEADAPFITSPGKPVKPRFSWPQVAWYLVFATLSFSSMLILNIPPGYPLLLFFVVMPAGAINWRNEGPWFVYLVEVVIEKLRLLRTGSIYTRRLSEVNQFVNVKGINDRVPFDTKFRAIPVTDQEGGETQLGTLDTPDSRHAGLLATNGWGASATSDGKDLMVYTQSLLSYLHDAAAVMKAGDTITLFNIRRPADVARETSSYPERVAEEVLNAGPEDGVAWAEKILLLDSTHHTLSQAWSTTQGLALSTAQPSYWKPRRLHKLTAEQIRNVPLVRMLADLQHGLSTLGLEDVKLQSIFDMTRTLKEAFATGPELDDFRSLLATDQRLSEQNPDASLEEFDSLRLGPFPTQHISEHGSYLQFQGTLHKVMWVANFRNELLELGAIAEVYEMPLDSMVSVSLELRDERVASAGFRIKSDWLDTFRKRRGDFKDDPKVELEDRRVQAEWQDFRLGDSVSMFMRMIVVVSAQDEQTLEDRAEMARATFNRNRMTLVDVHGSHEQLYWFMAALGLKHE